MELSLAGSVGSGSSGGSALQYGPGDSVGILASNDPTLVAALLQRLGVAATDVFSLTPVDASGGSRGHSCACSVMTSLALLEVDWTKVLGLS